MHTQELPQQLYLLGGGRHRQTRGLRRANRFGRRVFHLGSVVVRPNRRIPVTPEFVATNVSEIVKRVHAGTLIVQHDADTDCDVDEIRAIAAVVRGETPEGPIVKMVPEDEPDDDVIDNPDDDGSTTDPGLGEQEPAEQESEPEPEQQEPEAPAEEAPAEEPMDEPSPAEEAFGDEPTLSEPSFDESMGDMGDTGGDVAEMTALDQPFDAQTRFLPPGFSKLGKDELLALCEERGIKVKGKANPSRLISLLTAWKNAAS